MSAQTDTSRAWPGAGSPLWQALAPARGALFAILGFTLAGNLLALAGSAFMFEVYDRVLNSRNTRTLVMLALAVGLAYIVLTLLDWVRARALRAVGTAAEAELSARVLTASARCAERGADRMGQQLLTDLRAWREFTASPAVLAALDLPGALLFLVLIALVDTRLGALALAAVAVQALVLLHAERRTQPRLAAAFETAGQARAYLVTGARDAEVLQALGMQARLLARWQALHHKYLLQHAMASRHAGFESALGRFNAGVLTTLVLAIGTWLSLQGTLWGGAGMMLAASILAARVLSPIALLAAQWRVIVQARQAAWRLHDHLQALGTPQPRMPLPAPRGHLQVEGLTVTSGPSGPVLLRQISFQVKPGEVLAVIGRSGAGKSTLARALIGQGLRAAGVVRLDGADLSHWDRTALGPHIGYVSQELDLLAGTLADNIARFGPADPALLQEAVDLAGITAWIDQLPQGLHTLLGPGGAGLSGGQRQAVALARAWYGRPCLLVLDEPNSNLDEAGERALLAALRAARARGAAVVVVSHRPGVLPVVDSLLALRDGAIAAFGPRQQVMAQLQAGNKPRPGEREGTPHAIAS